MSKLNFFISRFHSLIALIPLGIFIIVHFLLNSSVFLGAEAHGWVVNMMQNTPFIIVAELVIIAIPIIFHGIYGIYVVYMAKNNVLRYKYYRNLAFYLQRITSLIMLAFLIWHVYTLRIAPYISSEPVPGVIEILHNPLYFVFYVIGVIAAIYHFTNGLFTFCITWGICTGDRAQKIFAICAVLAFIVMSLWACGILLCMAVA